jgi:CTP synthase
VSAKKPIKFIFVSGGVISGLGKGITAASLGMLLKSAGFRVSLTKADMYLNVDAGTMNPLEHGEVFVTDDGVETDQDLGHYERFLDENLSTRNYFTMGRVYWDVLQKERSLGYEGKCVEGHVHIPEEIIRKITLGAEEDQVDISIVEVGGTVGEYQNMMFFEAIRRLRQRRPGDVVLVHVVYLPIPKFLGEMKSKPAQASVYELYRLGLQPDFLVCRADEEVDEKRRKTIAFNTGVRYEHILTNPDVDTIYRVPIVLEQQEAKEKILKVLGLKNSGGNIKAWKEMLKKMQGLKKEVKIAIVGKYFTSGNFSLEDSYVCVIEAIKHAAWKSGLKPLIKWFDAEHIDVNELGLYDGIIVPQGWGSRGVEGKIKVVKFARENKIPYLGLCFGMQMAVIEFARNVVGLSEANSEEVDKSAQYPVVHIMPDQEKYLREHKYGGTIRLGAWPCLIKKGTILEEVYNKFGRTLDKVGIDGGAKEESEKRNVVSERHRHRYEFNNEYREILEKKGLVISGTSPDGKLVEAVELPKSVHPFFVGTQFHPEYKSRPLSPHPVFMALIESCIKHQEQG